MKFTSDGRAVPDGDDGKNEDKRTPMERSMDEYNSMLPPVAPMEDPARYLPRETLERLGEALGGRPELYGPAVTGRFTASKPPVEEVSRLDKPTVQLYGMQNLRMMSKEDLIAELCHHHSVAYNNVDASQLRHLLVHARVSTYSDRMHREAGMSDGGDIHG